MESVLELTAEQEDAIIENAFSEAYRKSVTYGEPVAAVVVEKKEPELVKAVEGVQQDSTQKTSGVLRGEHGKLLPGTRSLNPAGRKPRQYEKDMIAAIRNTLPPEKIEFWIGRALQLAEQQNSARGIISVLDFATAYAAGKPVQQVAVDAGKTELLEQLLHGDNGEPLLPDVADTNSTSVL